MSDNELNRRSMVVLKKNCDKAKLPYPPILVDYIANVSESQLDEALDEAGRALLEVIDRAPLRHCAGIIHDKAKEYVMAQARYTNLLRDWEQEDGS